MSGRTNSIQAEGGASVDGTLSPEPIGAVRSDQPQSQARKGQSQVGAFLGAGCGLQIAGWLCGAGAASHRRRQSRAGRTGKRPGHAIAQTADRTCQDAAVFCGRGWLAVEVVLAGSKWSERSGR